MLQVLPEDVLKRFLWLASLVFLFLSYVYLPPALKNVENYSTKFLQTEAATDGSLDHFIYLESSYNFSSPQSWENDHYNGNHVIIYKCIKLTCTP